MSALPSEVPLIVSVAAPTEGPAVGGVIVMGMGLADVRAVKRFAKLGFAALQMRLIQDSEHHNDLERRMATYDSSGVARCRHAMDSLATSHGVTRFILMGNCALANIAFNTAQADPRVAGLILTNPYISDTLMFSLSFKLRWRLRRARFWLRLLRGSMSLRRAAAQRDAIETSRLQGKHTKDLLLPPDFDRRLQDLLTSRGLRGLIVFSADEAGLEYFRRFYGGTLRALKSSGLLRFEVIDTGAHDFSERDEVARRLNDIVIDWARTNWPQPTNRDASRPPAALEQQQAR